MSYSVSISLCWISKLSCWIRICWTSMSSSIELFDAVKNSLYIAIY